MRIVYLIFAALGLLFFGACQTACTEPAEVAVLPENVPTETAPTPSRGQAVSTPTPLIGVSFATRVIPTTAVLQTTPTPLPTATAAPTATPIIYQIAAGDTILGVAIQHGTTVEEILALNPGVVPENLQIGQPIVLPPPATAIALAAQGTAVPLQVTVNKIHANQTSIGSLWLLGEVTNEGSAPVENIQVEIRLLAADGRSLATATAWTASSIILPGERSPFAILINEPPADFTQPTVAVVGGQVVVELGTRYLDVIVIDSIISHSDESVTLRGSFRNDGAEVANSVQLIATFYDSEGNVTGFQQQVVAEMLQVGEERPFHLETTPPGGETITYTLQTEAQLPLKIDN